MRLLLCLLFALFLVTHSTRIEGLEDDDIATITEDPRQEENMDADEGDEDDDQEEESSGRRSTLDSFLYKRMRQDSKPKRKPLPAKVYSIPGPQEPLPGRSHMGDYWPVFPFHSQYVGGVDLDPSISRHIGGDFNLAVPSWGMLDIYGRFFNRISDTTSKFGYLAQPVNMMDLEKEDFVQLMSNPSMQWNRNNQPRLPLGKLPKSYVPVNCRPPLCNPYHANFGFGMEHDLGGHDGVEGDIDVPIPISKGIAYRFPLSGKLYYDRDNITVTYGQNLAPIDPFASLFDYQKTRDPRIAIPRRRRQVVEDVTDSKRVWDLKEKKEQKEEKKGKADLHSLGDILQPSKARRRPFQPTGNGELIELTEFRQAFDEEQFPPCRNPDMQGGGQEERQERQWPEQREEEGEGEGEYMLIRAPAVDWTVDPDLPVRPDMLWQSMVAPLTQPYPVPEYYPQVPYSLPGGEYVPYVTAGDMQYVRPAQYRPRLPYQGMIPAYMGRPLYPDEVYYE